MTRSQPLHRACCGGLDGDASRADDGQAVVDVDGWLGVGACGNDNCVARRRVIHGGSDARVVSGNEDICGVRIGSNRKGEEGNDVFHDLLIVPLGSGVRVVFLSIGKVDVQAMLCRGII